MVESGGRFRFKDEYDNMRHITLGKEGEALTVLKFAIHFTAAVSGYLVTQEAVYLGMLDHPTGREIIVHFRPAES